MPDTADQYGRVADACRRVFEVKTHDYGTAWRVLRLSSVVDQIYIKAGRIRSIEENGTQKIQDDIYGDYQGIFNYAIIGLIQIDLSDTNKLNYPPAAALELYDQHLSRAKELMLAKNHDYGEAWRQMQVSSFTDIVLMRLMRLRQLLNATERSESSEGPDANFYDIVNYAAFALIKLGEHEH